MAAYYGEKIVLRSVSFVEILFSKCRFMEKRHSQGLQKVFNKSGLLTVFLDEKTFGKSPKKTGHFKELH